MRNKSNRGFSISRKFARNIFTLATVSLSLAACGSSSNSASSNSSNAGPSTTTVPVTTISVGNTSKTAVLWPIFVGQDEGFFKKNNIKVNIVLLPSDSSLIQGTITGAIDVASASVFGFIQGVSGGAKIKIIASGVNQPIYNIVAAKNITSWSQLTGKTVMVDAPSGITHYYFDTVAKAKGFNPSSVNLTYAGATSQRYAALISGAVAAAVLTAPFDAEALGAGYNGLGQVSKYLPNSPFSALGVSTSWASQHKTALTALVKALSQSNTWLNNPANKAAAEAILIKDSQTTQAAADSSYTSLITQLKVFPNSGVVSATALGTLLKGVVQDGFFPASTNTNPQTYIDNSYAP